MMWAEDHNKTINYLGIEPYPITLEQAAQLNYPEIIGCDPEQFQLMHHFYNEKQVLSRNFAFQILKEEFDSVVLSPNQFDLIYFDAFSPEAQPELWIEDVFRRIADSSKKGAILTTYSCKGIVKRALKAAAFQIEKLPGPPGKREILRAVLN